MSTRLVVDWAVYPEDRIDREARTGMQKAAVEHLVYTAPKSIEVVVQTTARDAPFPKWPRDGQGSASDKSVPYVGDMFDRACADPAPDWAGICNSDVFVMSHGWEKLEACFQEPADAIICHRTDVTSSEFLRLRRYSYRKSAHVRGKPAPSAWSTDMIFLRPRVWQEYRLKILDEMVIGEPFWDTAVIWWLARLNAQKNLNVIKLRRHELVHQVHGGGWDFSSPWATRAAKLYYAEFPEVKETRGHYAFPLLSGAENEASPEVSR